MNDLNETRCRSCNKKIVFAELPGGGRIPLDLVAPVYELDAQGMAIRVNGNDGSVANKPYVTHFATCPNASQHSKKKIETKHPDSEAGSGQRTVVASAGRGAEALPEPTRNSSDAG